MKVITARGAPEHYILGSLMITLTVDPKDPNLFGGFGSNDSPL